MHTAVYLQAVDDTFKEIELLISAHNMSVGAPAPVPRAEWGSGPACLSCHKKFGVFRGKYNFR